MKDESNIEIPVHKEQAVQIGIKAHLAFRRHSEARINAIRDGSWLDPASQTVLFRLQAEYDLLQEEYRKALHALREASPEEYGQLLREIAQQIREEVSQTPMGTVQPGEENQPL